jgi:hypothetical protein
MATVSEKRHRRLEAVDLLSDGQGGYVVVLEDGTRYALIVDMEYQRPLDQRKVEQIREDWDPIAADPIVLSLRAKRVAAIVNGQHQIHAALLEGETELLAEVFTGLTVPREADLRLKKNNSRPDTVLEKFYARLAAEKPRGGKATDIVALLAEFDTQVNRSPNKHSGINCIGTVERLYDRREGMILRRTLLLLTESYKKLAGPVVSSPLLEGAAWFLAVHEGEYSWRKLTEQMKKHGPDGIYDMSRGFKKAMGGSDWLNHYRAMVEAYNKSVRKPNGKLEMKTSRWTAEMEGSYASNRAKMRTAA